MIPTILKLNMSTYLDSCRTEVHEDLQQHGVDTNVDTFENKDLSTSQLKRIPAGLIKRYHVNPDDVENVMQRFAIGDVEQLLRTAIMLDSGSYYLTKAMLLAAGKSLHQYHFKGYTWSPQLLAQMMQHMDITSQSALTCEALRQDNGDKYLNRSELTQACHVLNNTLKPFDLSTVLNRCKTLQQRDDVHVTTLGYAGDYPIHCIDLPCLSKQEPTLRVLITSGVHGNEPCGPGTSLLLLDQILNSANHRSQIHFTLIPMINPTGYLGKTRHNQDNLDLNRCFTDNSVIPSEVQAIKRFMQDRTYDVALDLHSGGNERDGFWVLHINSENEMKSAFSSFQYRWPVLHGYTKPYHLIQPGVGFSDTPHTLKEYCSTKGCYHSATVEAPGSISYLDQVFGQNDLVWRIISQFLLEKNQR